MEMVLLTTLQLAKRLGIAPITLQIWRSHGICIPFVKQGTRVFYRLADVQDYERLNIDSLSAWLLGSDRPLPEMEALVRAANLPLQKIRQRIASPLEIDGDAMSPPPQPADAIESPEPEQTEPSAYSDWQPLVPPEHSSHQSPINSRQPLPMLRAMATAMLTPPVNCASAPVFLPIALPAPEQTIAAPLNIHHLQPVGMESIPTAPLLKDCNIVESTPLVTPLPTGEEATPPELATPQPMPSQLIAPAFSTQSCAPSTLAWYLIHTKPRQEALALTNLSRQGFECYMPMLRLQKIRQRKTALVAEPMFPRYLFIRLDTSGSGQSWSPIRSTLGVNQLVRFGGQPAKVDGQLIDLIRSREQGTQAQALFSAGDNVTVADGPFAGLEAIYQNTDAESRSMILLNILSKPVAMRIDSASLRKTG